VVLFAIPHGRLLFDHLFPHSIHNVWAVVSISLLVVVCSEVDGGVRRQTLVQFVGLRALTDLRNQVYQRLSPSRSGFSSSSQPGGDVGGD